MALFAELNPAPVFSFNTEGRLVSANKIARDLFDIDPGQDVFVASLLPAFEELDPARIILQNETLIFESRYKQEYFQFTLRGISELNIGHAYGSEITERKRQEEAMRVIVEGTSRATGEHFFRSLAYHLASALQVKSAAVTENIALPSLHPRILALWDGKQFHEGCERCLTSRVWHDAAEKEIFLNGNELQHAFPHNEMLRTHRIESYWSVPMFNSFQQAIGHLLVMDTRPLKRADWNKSILKIFAARAASELERVHAELELHAARDAAELGQ